MMLIVNEWKEEFQGKLWVGKREEKGKIGEALSDAEAPNRK
jgi:hypothetical protein